MYNWFYITEPVWNNAFSSEKRKWRSIYIPPIINWTLDDLKIWKEIVFEECDEIWNIISFNWLQNFIKTEIFWIPTYIFDNHNHAFYFWAEAIKEWVINSWWTLIHIDEHSDMREPDFDLGKNSNLEEIFDYTNNTLNVWNYIKPALKAGFIGKIIKIQWEEALNSVINEIENEENDIILNLDIDFFSPGMWYIDFEKAKKIVINVAQKAKLITIATSPFFIDQNRAIEVIKELFIINIFSSHYFSKVS